MAPRFLDRAPDEAIGPPDRISPLRRPDGFVPAVQRWSFQLPPEAPGLTVAFFGAQAPDEASLDAHPLHGWVREALDAHRNGPSCLDHARASLDGRVQEHVVAAYWASPARFRDWAADGHAEAWWQAPERLDGALGTWREIFQVPRDRQESIYWADYPGGLMTSPDVAIFPTPYCGYYGAMRDRLPAAATDLLDAAPGHGFLRSVARATRHAHWSVQVPHNLAVIRSAHGWGRMDEEQLADYRVKLRRPLAAGMDYLKHNPVPTGCATLRWLTTTTRDGALQPEAHAIGYFLSLRHLERWAENHATHEAIFSAAIARYRSYGPANQLRTWHEVFVLPGGEQRCEYLNCDPATGLLPYFAAERLR